MGYQLNIPDIHKVGNIISYLVSSTDYDMSLKKVVKLLFFIDELSVEKTGVPITWLNHCAWHKGPVAPEVYFSAINILNEYPEKSGGLDDYVTVVEGEYKGTNYPRVSNISDPDTKEFTKYELSVIDEIIEKYGEWSGIKLEKESHIKDGLWDTIVVANDLQQRFDEGETMSRFPIDFYGKIESDELKKLNFKSAQESRKFDLVYC